MLYYKQSVLIRLAHRLYTDFLDFFLWQVTQHKAARSPDDRHNEVYIREFSTIWFCSL